jgi:hypothetical protein
MTPEQIARYARQLMLREVGREGQERVLGATAAVAGPAGSLAHEVAARYARRAGFAAVAAGSIDREALAPAGLVESEAAREVLAGSRLALAALRDALGMGSRGNGR